MSSENILVIKHGALGDIVLATGAFAAIRAAHPGARIHCLTTSTYAGLLAQSPYFDEIWVDSKPRWYERAALKRLKLMLRSKRWAWVYDLQCSKRTTLYQWLFKRPWPNISNASSWVSQPRGEYDASRHALDNLRGQLALAGLHDVGAPDVDWLDEPLTVSDIRLTPPYALLVPGGAPHRPEKRWPAEQYASLAMELAARGFTPILLGTRAEEAALDSIAKRVPSAVNLSGKTSIAQLATLARKAAVAVGNDTGPMHVIAASGCPSTVLFSHASDPVRSAPLGPTVSILRERELASLPVDRVLSTLTPRT